MQENTNMVALDGQPLRDIKDIHIDTSLDKDERMKQYVAQIGNPYCYMDQGTVVRIRFRDTQVTLEQRLQSYLNDMQQMM